MYRSKVGIRCGIALAALLFLATSANAQRQMERLGRGVVAINQGGGKSFVSWRLLGTEPDSVAFNIYRATGDAPPVKLNAEPITKCTCYQDSGVDPTKDNVYTLRPVLNGQEGEASKSFHALSSSSACDGAPRVEATMRCQRRSSLRSESGRATTSSRARPVATSGASSRLTAGALPPRVSVRWMNVTPASLPAPSAPGSSPLRPVPQRPTG